MQHNDNINNEPFVVPIKPKRGRKSKLELEKSLNKLNGVQEPITDILNSELVGDAQSACFELDQVPQTKKRGRKPKCGKIIQNSTANTVAKFDNVNVVLHLNCSISNLTDDDNMCIKPFDDQPNINMSEFVSPNISDVFAEQPNPMSSLHNVTVTSENYACVNNNCYSNTATTNTEDIRHKLYELSFCLQHNICNKKSACFWCTCDFDNIVIHIPKSNNGGVYQVYGCFCSPECSAGFLFNESLDNQTKFERYNLLNRLYGKIYNFTTNIIPAASPHYLLDKFCGNMNIHEYRSTFNNNRLFLVLDKPLTRILPELHEDNNDCLLNSRLIASSNSTTTDKTDIVNMFANVRLC